MTNRSYDYRDNGNAPYHDAIRIVLALSHHYRPIIGKIYDNYVHHLLDL